MACLTIELRSEAAHLRDPPLQIAAVTLIASASVADKSRRVIGDPILGVLPGWIDGRSTGMAVLSVEI
jgi:hypothetical protein